MLHLAAWICIIYIASSTASETGYSIHQCDETKCRSNLSSLKLHWPELFLSFPAYCWAPTDSVTDSTNCADGYEPRPVEQYVEPIPGSDGNYTYFTCCPPDYEGPITNQCDSTLTACSSSFDDCYVSTGFGTVEAILCDDQDNDIYNYPNIVTEVGNVLVYACCETEDGSLSDGPYIQNTSFKITVISFLVLSSASFLITSILIMTLLTSMLFKSRSLRKSYNLYILFLTIPDWLLNLGFIVTYSMALANAGRNFRDMFFFLLVSCSTANIWINTIICYEVHKMVLRSYRRERTNPPTILMTLLQCLGVYVVTFTFYGSTIFTGAFFDGIIFMVLTAVFFGFLPAVYLIYATWRIRKTGLLSVADKRTKGLTLYFARVIIVFFAFFIPALLFAMYGVFRVMESPYDIDWPTAVQIYLFILQGAASAAMAMTKDDIHKSVLDFKSKVFTARHGSAFFTTSAWKSSIFNTGGFHHEDNSDTIKEEDRTCSSKVSCSMKKPYDLEGDDGPRKDKGLIVDMPIEEKVSSDPHQEFSQEMLLHTFEEITYDSECEQIRST